MTRFEERRIVALSPNAMLPENQPYERELISLSIYRLQTSSFPNEEGVTPDTEVQSRRVS